ncbi:DUF4184 family protein [Flammeovirga sp. SubArs3]|uniref:DUF4184 family protein n=1 Tax=Flammeovirga sp. SubArs3 TaxID=2995316 RepID=UPI00248D0980|nr:DUF4184 family protein [Flammeovirga sp. SubArs3]
MPITFAHTAYIFPFKKIKQLSFMGLLLGSIIPDFEHLFILDFSPKFGHTLLGVFLFDIPVALAFYFIWEKICFPVLKEVLPFEINDTPKALSIKWVLVSIIIGIGSHLILDGVSGTNGFFVKRLPVLSTDLSKFGYNHIKLFIFNWYTFSILGTFIVFIQIVKYISNCTLKKVYDHLYYFFFIEMLTIAEMIVFIRMYNMTLPDNYLKTGVIVCGSLMYSLIFTSFHWKYLIKKLKQKKETKLKERKIML